MTTLKDQDFEAYGETSVDSRNRVTLTSAIAELLERFKIKPSRFTVYINRAGQVLLSPKIDIPLDEAWLFKNPKALESVIKGMAQAKEGKVHPLESFAAYADDEID